MNSANAQNEPYLQFFHCSPRSNKAGVRGYLYLLEDGYTLVLEGHGAMCAPKARFHPIWGPYSDQIHHIIIGEGITEIESRCFTGLKNLQTIQFPETLTAIYSEAFKDCTSLRELLLP